MINFASRHKMGLHNNAKMTYFPYHMMILGRVTVAFRSHSILVLLKYLCPLPEKKFHIMKSELSPVHSWGLQWHSRLPALQYSKTVFSQYIYYHYNSELFPIYPVNSVKEARRRSVSTATETFKFKVAS